MEFDQFLTEICPALGLQWRRFERRGIRRRVERRIIELGLSSFEAYSLRIQKDPEEQKHLAQILTVTISRFFRDGKVFEKIETSVMPAILRKDRRALRVWSIGCASGEEPYSLALLWQEKAEENHPGMQLSILATDIDEGLLQRAHEGRYKRSSVEEIPGDILARFFKYESGFYVLDEHIRERVEFKKHDVINEQPFPEMDLVLCRNLAFTYFSKQRQMDVLKKIASSLNEECFLVIGENESLPLTYPTLFVPAFPREKIYQKFSRAKN
jgi:chemotaxis methyl-accepting protein methylase